MQSDKEDISPIPGDLNSSDMEDISSNKFNSLLIEEDIDCTSDVYDTNISMSDSVELVSEDFRTQKNTENLKTGSGNLKTSTENYRTSSDLKISSENFKTNNIESQLLSEDIFDSILSEEENNSNILSDNLEEITSKDYFNSKNNNLLKMSIISNSGNQILQSFAKSSEKLSSRSLNCKSDEKNIFCNNYKSEEFFSFSDNKFMSTEANFKMECNLNTSNSNISNIDASKDLISSDFMTGNLKKIKININNLKEPILNENLEIENLENKNTSNSNISNIDASKDLISSDFMTGNLKKIKININNLKDLNFDDKLENLENKNTSKSNINNIDVSKDLISSDFMTGNLKKIKININNLKEPILNENLEIENLENKNTSNSNISNIDASKDLISSDFMTGNLKKIKININNLKDTNIEKENIELNIIAKDVEENKKNIENLKSISSLEIEKIEKPYKSNIHFQKFAAPDFVKITNKKIENFYNFLFKKRKPSFFEYQNFKFSFLFCSLNSKVTEENIIEQYNKRKSNEYSILRRIFEGDSSPTSHMILEIHRICRKTEHLILYDGFFTSKFFYDKEISKKIISQKIKLFDKLRIFGSFFKKEKEFKDCKFNIFYNSTQKVSNFYCKNKNLGLQKKISFVKNFNELTKNGGNVSGLEFEVKKIVFDKVTIKVNNFKQTVLFADLENKLALISNKLQDFNENIDDATFVRFYKLLVKDLHSENCFILVSYLDLEDLRVGKKYRVSNLSVGAFLGMGFIAYKGKSLYNLIN